VSWIALLAACGLCYLTKLAGYLAPHRWLERPRVRRTAAMVTVALLSALVSVQTLATAGRLELDARVPALGLAAVLLWRRAPFIVVVVAAGTLAALLRLM
jgi:branched-subunit amino acid transport protein